VATQTKAHCALCQKEYAKAGMSKHLSTCLGNYAKAGMSNYLQAAVDKGKPQAFTHLLVTAPGLSAYWLHLLVNSATPLKKLDQFLREIWLECCGHLSAFNAKQQAEPLSMTTKIANALPPGTRLDYQYDFGSTTELSIQSLANYVVPEKLFKDKLILLARNQAPTLACSYCGKPAVQICTECAWDGEGWLCASCPEEHERGEDMYLPVVNSPRVGVCAYTGE